MKIFLLYADNASTWTRRRTASQPAGAPGGTKAGGLHRAGFSGQLHVIIVMTLDQAGTVTPATLWINRQRKHTQSQHTHGYSHHSLLLIFLVK